MEGKVIILSAGMGGSARYWEPNLAALSEHNQVLLYDHRGTGRSDQNLPEPVTIESMADDVEGLMAELCLSRPDFIGHALGGLVGLVLAARAKLGRLVVVNGWAELDPHFNRCFEIRLKLLERAGPAAYARAQPIFLYPAPWISEHFDRIEAEAQHQILNFPSVPNLQRRIAAARAFRLDSPIEGEVLAVAATDDMLVPVTSSRLLVERLPDARLEEMSWGGHACNVTDPATFNRLVLEFLGS